MITYALLVLALLGALVTTILSLFAPMHWVADILANLRVQQAIGLGCLLLGTVILRKWKLLWVIVPLAGIHTFFFVHTSEAPTYVRPGPGKPCLRLMLANVLSSNRQHQRIIDAGLDSQADVIVILELTSELDRKLQTSWKASYPYQKSIPQDQGNFGIGLYSNQAFQNLEVHEDVQNIPSLSVMLDKVLLVATHPLPPMGARSFALREKQLAAIDARLDSKTGPPTILVGDLNITPWSPNFIKLKDRSLLRRATKGDAFKPTWYASKSALFPFGLALDHALISWELHCAHYEVGEDLGSDHRPVLWDLNLVE